MYKQILIAIIIGIFQQNLSAQSTIAWQKLVDVQGFVTDTRLDDIAITPDNAYLISGYRSDTANSLNYSFLCSKLLPDATDVEWTRLYGGSGEEQANALVATPDSGAIMVGHSASPDGDVGKWNGNLDVWMIRIDAHGDIVWANVWGGSLTEDATAISLATDGNYWVTGYTESADSNLTYNAGYKDVFLLKIDAQTGNILQQHTYGGTGNDVANAVHQNPLTQTVWLGGYSSSTDGDVTGNHGSKDFWLLNINPNNGNLRWQRSYGGTASDAVTDMVLTNDGNIVLLGDALSNDGEVPGNYGQDDFWLIKVDTIQGNIIWNTHIGEAFYDQSRNLIENPNGDIMAIGTTFDPSIAPPNYAYDVLILKINGQNGNLKWQKRFGGSNFDFANRIVPAVNGGYLLACSTDSQDGDIDTGGGRHGSHRGWLIRVSETTGINNQQLLLDYQIYPNPCQNILQINTNAVLDAQSSLQIYNAQQQLIHQQTLTNNNRIDWQNYPTGVYYLILQTPKGIATTNIVHIKQ